MQEEIEDILAFHVEQSGPDRNGSDAPRTDEELRALHEKIRRRRESGPTITDSPEELKRKMREGLA